MANVRDHGFGARSHGDRSLRNLARFEAWRRRLCTWRLVAVSVSDLGREHLLLLELFGGDTRVLARIVHPPLLRKGLLLSWVQASYPSPVGLHAFRVSSALIKRVARLLEFGRSF